MLSISKKQIDLSNNEAGKLVRPSVWDVRYFQVSLFGQPALLTKERIDLTTVPDGYYAYCLRHGDNSQRPETVEPFVGVNYFGAVLLHAPLDFMGNDYLPLKRRDLAYSGRKQIFLLPPHSSQNQKHKKGIGHEH